MNIVAFIRTFFFDLVYQFRTEDLLMRDSSF